MDQTIPESVQRLDVAEEWRAIQNLCKPYQEAAAALKKEQEMAKELLMKIRVEMGKRDNVKTLPDDRLEVTFRWAEWEQQDIQLDDPDHQLAYKLLTDLFGDGNVKAIPGFTPEKIRRLDFAVTLPL